MAKIRFYTVPSKLFRYRPLGNHLCREIKALKEAYVYCSDFSAMNDPMEGMHRASLGYIMKGLSRSESELIFQAKSTLGIASFSEVPDHEPMWAHYADQFKGMCVGYKTTSLLANITHECDFVRMSYGEEPPLILDDGATVSEKAKSTLGTKALRWMSEREWRLITPERGFAFYNDVNCAFTVYLGSRVDAEDEHLVRSEMENLKVRVLKMKIDKYKVEFTRTGN